MPKQLESGKKFRRLIKVYGVEELVEVTISAEGLSFRIPSTRGYLVAAWPDVVEKSSLTPDNSPSFLAGEPTKYLQHEVAKVVKNRIKRATK
jgi:hypothetical protein